MNTLTIVIGADHRGFAKKQYLMEHIKKYNNVNVAWIDVGAFDAQRSDYPTFAILACQKIMRKDADLGVLLCGTGVGMTIAANRFSGIYAGLAWNSEVARLNREDDNCNVLAIPADYVSCQQAQELVLAWLKASFRQGRYQERIALIDQISV